ncbi:MAG: zinc-binding protein [Peptococcaceae bacterium]|nr:MAG: zinc-binding protein [Peptococcaceae bacterium]
MFEDKVLNCRDCGNDFVFTVSEQEFYTEKGFTNDPSRCPECRAARKRTRSSEQRGGYYGQSNREMFQAVCAKCGQQTQVPFKPNTEKPVYCPDCFRAQKRTSNNDRYSMRRY